MSFSTDPQTLNDLNLTGKPGSSSIYNLFNHTYTRGGADLLEKMFLYPLSDAVAINNRSSIFQYFSAMAMPFPFKTEYLDSAELYLAMTDARTRLSTTDQGLAKRFSQLISTDGDYKMIYSGITAILQILHALHEFTNAISNSAKATPYQASLQEMKDVFADPEFHALLEDRQGGRLAYAAVAAHDHLFRFKHRQKIKTILSWIYHIDVYLSIAEVALKHKFVFPVALPQENHMVKLDQLYHPLVKNAVANDIQIDPESNIIFLTGANMAGKSTFMKSLGIAMYLAHMGFPVAAKSMQFSVRDGMFTTINLPDDLSSGNSHFYAEVLRVKKIAKELSVGKNLFVIFDELFRGTNVKDACEGTIAITAGFAKRRNCMFVVSTHIIEAGEVLKTRCSNINFVYLPTLMEGSQPVYTYTLKPGITADRHGMIIINNERILEIIRSRTLQKNRS
jgi:DNA mismatch repair protein MutS